MSVTKQIANAEHCMTGDMICKTCKKPIISGNYLIVEHYISKRGNEDDYNETFCYDCTKDQNVWKEYFADEKREKEKYAIQLIKDKQKANQIIKYSSYIEFGQDEDGNPCIFYT